MWSPWASHPYAYCGNNPIAFVDPLGLFELSAFTSGFQEGFTGAFIGVAKTAGIKVIASIIGKAFPGVGTLVAVYNICTMAKAVYSTSKLALMVASGQTSDKESSKFVGALAGMATALAVVSAGSKGVSYLKERVSTYLKGKLNNKNAVSSVGLLPIKLKIPIGNQKYGLKHILQRHSSNTTANNVSKFSEQLSANGIRRLIVEGGEKGTEWRVEGASRVLEVNMGRTIGTDISGNASSWLRIITNSSGSVISAYPIPGEN